MSGNVLTKICTIVTLFMGLNASAQLTVTTNSNALQLAQKILGKGVTITNAQLKGGSLQAGTFKAVAGSFLIDSGVVLTTGYAKTGSGPGGTGVGVNATAGTQSATSYSSDGSTGDADLTFYGDGATTNDACVLEFDFVPQGDSIYVRYIFGSEEYPEYACTQFNDIFAFIISGPGILGKKNIALVPITAANVPVKINTVNSGIPGANGGQISFCQQPPGSGSPFPQFYVDNTSGSYVVFDGHTIVLTAKAKVTPCLTYHIRIGVADVSDGSHDSGVFIEANSFSSKKEINTSTQGPYTDPQNNNSVTMIEACKDAQLTLTRAADVTGAFTLNTTYAGTAAPNVDFTTDLPATVTFAANENVKTFNFAATPDAVNEGLEKIVVRFSKGTCATSFVDSAILFIRDSLIYRSKKDTSFCPSAPITITGHDPVPVVVNSYLWSTSATSQSIVVNQPGTYTVTHTYSQRCLNVDTFNVINNGPQLSVNNPNISICPGDTATLIATTSASGVTWNTGASTNSIKVTAAGKYWVTASNANCAKTDTVTVTTKSAPSVYLGIDTGMCQNKTLVLDATYPGATYLWSNGATTSSITVNTAGTYSVINTLNGCTANDTINISVNPVPSVYLGNDTSICADKTLPLNATFAGATYSWSTGATTPTINANTTGQYWVVNSLGGCVASDTINLVAKPLPALELGADRSVCAGDTIHLDATFPGATYSWSNGATTGAIVASVAAKYVVVSTLNGCSAKDSMTLAVKPIPVVALGNDTSFCENKSVVLNATFAGASYSWSNGATSPTINVNTAGTYSVINSLNGCFSKDTINIATKPIPALELGADRAVCAGDTIHLDATYPGATYSWNNGATTGSIVASTGAKYVVISSMNGCSNTDSMTLTLKPIPVVNLGIDTSICENVTLNLNATFAGASYSWNTGATTATIPVSTAGQYSVINTLNGCFAKDTINVTTKSAPLLELGANKAICDYEQVTLDATYPNASYLWNTGAVTPTIIVNKAGKYSVISTLSGCPAMDTVTVNAKKMPVINAGIDIVIQQNTTAQLNATQHSNNAIYLWTPAATLSDPTLPNPIASPTVPVTDYTVHVTSIDGCIAEDMVTVRVVYPIKIPNAFSPNGDGVNDKWVITNIELYPRSRVYIFNRYGQQIYNEGGFKGAWDGSYKGKLLEPATYYYIVDVGDGIKHTGYLVLLR